MADWAHAFLSKVVLEEEMAAAVNARITPEFFRNDDYALIWRFMLDHFNEHGTAPDEQVARPGLPQQSTGSHRSRPSATSSTECSQDRKYVILTQVLSEAVTSIVQDERPTRSPPSIQEALIQARLETSKSLDADFTTARQADRGTARHPDGQPRDAAWYLNRASTASTT